MPSSSSHATIERCLQDIDWAKLTRDRRFYPSPTHWEDEVLYFLFVDRFSDGREHGGFADARNEPVTGPSDKRPTPLFDINSDANQADRNQWFDAGRTWCGGHLAGLEDKLGYLKRMGVTALWLSPIFKQVPGRESYHGYGIQNFLDVDPHFGTREELRHVVKTAHDLGIRVILDIILNHAGDVFAYQNDVPYYYYQDRQWPAQGYRASDDGGPLPLEPVDLVQHPNAWPDQAVWPAEFQDTETWQRRGQIRGWDRFPEYLGGDFYGLKDIDHGPAPKDPDIAWDVRRRVREFRVAPALVHLCEVYKYWIAYADIDAYRIDTVKHMEPGAVRFFANVIHEFAQSIGKDNFYLIGEVTGGRPHAVNIVNTTGLDAALGINDIPDKLEFLAKGWRSPGHPHTEAQEGYFDLFRNSLLDGQGTHQWYGRHVVTLFDDHDQVGTKHKFRFCGDRPDSHRFLPLALGLNLTTVGIPCIYYGTEQAFNGADQRTGDDDGHSDTFLRECMFGGPFGSYQSSGRHFFKESHPMYKFVRRLCELRQQHMALRRGRQYLRAVSNTGQAEDFHYPQPVNHELRWVVAWSRLFADQEILCAMNTDTRQARRVWVTVDRHVTRPDGQMTCLFSTDPDQVGTKVTVATDPRTMVQITMPATGFAVYC